MSFIPSIMHGAAVCCQLPSAVAFAAPYLPSTQYPVPSRDKNPNVVCYSHWLEPPAAPGALRAPQSPLPTAPAPHPTSSRTRAPTPSTVWRAQHGQRRLVSAQQILPHAQAPAVQR
ncbi:hypothetical protein B484DRAFT_249740 [Ochromonadaceae sp. CCMP2298]|nr:hypothetical protein B484DRAFT_249740 [Ochromonadaceae sp. CCMP2298]